MTQKRPRWTSFVFLFPFFTPNFFFFPLLTQWRQFNAYEHASFKGNNPRMDVSIIPRVYFLLFCSFYLLPTLHFSFVSHFHLCEVLWHIFFALFFMCPRLPFLHIDLDLALSQHRVPLYQCLIFFSFSAVMPPFFFWIFQQRHDEYDLVKHTHTKKMNWLKKLKKRQMNKSEAAAMTPFYYACGCAKLF